MSDYRQGRPGRIYRSQERSLIGAPPARRDLIQRRLYLVPNSIVVSRGCPHTCDFCYKEAFYRGGKSFYTQAVDQALAEIERLPGRHLYFLDDHLFGNPRFAAALFDGMRGMGRLWQAAGTVKSVLQPGLLEKAALSGLRSLFVGFETLSEENLRSQGKLQNLNRDYAAADYAAAVHRLHEHGVMVNASFVFGMDHDDETVFDRTVAWAVEHGVETATFHILTPYPGTALHERLAAQGRITITDWDLYDTRHAVFRPARMSRAALEAGYWRSYRQFYRWGSIARSARAHEQPGGGPAPFCLCRRLEEVRAVVGLGHPCAAGEQFLAPARVHPGGFCSPQSHREHREGPCSPQRRGERREEILTAKKAREQRKSCRDAPPGRLLHKSTGRLSVGAKHLPPGSWKGNGASGKCFALNSLIFTAESAEQSC